MGRKRTTLEEQVGGLVDHDRAPRRRSRPPASARLLADRSPGERADRPAIRAARAADAGGGQRRVA